MARTRPEDKCRNSIPIYGDGSPELKPEDKEIIDKWIEDLGDTISGSSCFEPVMDAFDPNNVIGWKPKEGLAPSMEMRILCDGKEIDRFPIRINDDGAWNPLPRQDGTKPYELPRLSPGQPGFGRDYKFRDPKILPIYNPRQDFGIGNPPIGLRDRFIPITIFPGMENLNPHVPENNEDGIGYWEIVDSFYYYLETAKRIGRVGCPGEPTIKPSIRCQSAAPPREGSDPLDKFKDLPVPGLPNLKGPATTAPPLKDVENRVNPDDIPVPPIPPGGFKLPPGVRPVL